MNLLKAARAKFLKTVTRAQGIQTGLAKREVFNEKYSKHRNFVGLYDLRPSLLLASYLAPNSTLVGEVTVGSYTSIWYNSVIRGDLNAVYIGNYTSIGDHSVIHTAGSLPNGMPASVTIGDGVVIQSGSTIYSAFIEDEVLVGHRSVILEGSRLEKGCVIGANSVVPPGRIIPGYQLWAGNPVEYVRDLTKQEKVFMLYYAKVQLSLNRVHHAEFLPYRSAYLLKDNSPEDVEPAESEYRDLGMDSSFTNKSKSLHSIYN